MRINAVSPGNIDTPMTSGIPAPVHPAFAGLHLLGRPGRPQEVA